MLSKENVRLLGLVDLWESKLPSCASEEAVGHIRSAVGKARLLVLTNPKGRFKQFQGLVDDCQHGRGDKPTTCTDLQGFWDMIFYQVEDVDGLFNDLKVMEGNGWAAKPKEDETKKENRVVKRKRKAATSIQKSSVERRCANAGLKKMMAAGRKEVEADKKKAASASLLEATTPSSVLRPVNKSVEKVFEGGFFAVRSPVRPTSASASPASSSRLKPVDNSLSSAATLDFDEDRS